MTDWRLTDFWMRVVTSDTQQLQWLIDTWQTLEMRAVASDTQQLQWLIDAWQTLEMRTVASDTQQLQWLIDAWQTFVIDFDNFRHLHIRRGRFHSTPSLKIHTTTKENGPHGKRKALNTSLSKVTSEKGQPLSSWRVSVVTGFQKLQATNQSYSYFYENYSKVTSERGQPLSSLSISVVTGFQKLQATNQNYSYFCENYSEFTRWKSELTRAEIIQRYGVDSTSLCIK